MKDNNVEEVSCDRDIKVVKIVGEFDEDCTYVARALISVDKEIVSDLGKKLKEFLDDNSLIGGVMDRRDNLYEFELILKNNELEVASPKRVSTYMIEFLEFLRKEFTVEIENNFDGLELTAGEFEKLLVK